MQSWKQIQATLASSVASVDISGINKNFKNTVQSTRERFGQIDPNDVTELPAEYKALEARVDALSDLHKGMLKITKVHETESYDYPTQIAESMSEFGQTVSAGWSSFASQNLKNVKLPGPLSPAATEPSAAAPAPPKTLPHALSRAAKAGSAHIGLSDKLGKSLNTYGDAMEKVGDARVQQDHVIVDKFLTPWQATLSSSIMLAMKARANVRDARLELDAARAAMKSAAPPKQEQYRLQVEEAEDKLVQMTETAIGLMKAVLENPEPLQNLSNLVNAQLIFYSTAAETLSNIQEQIAQAATEAESEYRETRAA